MLQPTPPQLDWHQVLTGRPYKDLSIDVLCDRAETGTVIEVTAVFLELENRRSKAAARLRARISDLLAAAVRRETVEDRNADWREKVASLPEAELRQLWQNTVRWLGRVNAIGRGGNPARIQRKLEAIEAEWARRQRSDPARFPNWWGKVGSRGNAFSMSPQAGMLSYLGYRVGRERGVEPAERRFLLDRIHASVLPPLNSPAYVQHWGKAGSEERRDHMITVLRSLAGAARYRVEFAVAVEDWTSDAIYLSRKGH